MGYCKNVVYIYLAFFLLSVSACKTLHIEERPEDWVQLFNGKNMDGWTPKIRGFELGDNHNNTFVVEDGLLKAKYDEYDTFDSKFGHLFYKDSYSYYRLKVEYRFVGEQCNGGPGWAFRNNGLMLHAQSANSMGKDQDFPISIEVQLLGGDGQNPRTTANLCTPGTNVVMGGELFTPHCTSSSSETYHGDQWVHAEIQVFGDSLFRHIVEGQAVLEYASPQMGGGAVGGHDAEIMKEGQLLDRGYITIQGESHPTEFRKIELLNLEGCMDKNAKNYKSYFVKHRPGDCEY